MKYRSRQFDKSTHPINVRKFEGYKGIIGSGKTNDRLRIILWNVNGIRSVLSKGAMRDLIGQYVPDFICITETKINH